MLGEMINGDIAFWSMPEGKAKFYKISIKNLTLDQLIQIGGWEVATRVCRKKNDEDDERILFTTLKKHIILTANRVQLGKMESLGQGIHALTRGRMLLVNGKAGWIFENNHLTLHQYPLLERKFLEFEEGADWIDPDALAAALAGMNRQKAFETLTKLLELLSQWTFEDPMDPLTIAGFILAQIVQTAWTWRPHMWVNGTQGSGKSRLLRLFKSIFGKLVVIHEGNATSEAGLRQKLDEGPLMTYIDEFESNKERDKIIELLRTCGGGGESTKGSPNRGGVNAYRLRHMIMVCSVEVGLKRAAEKNRYLIVSTKKQRGHKTPEPPSSTTCEDLKNNLVALALWGLAEARELVRTIGQIGPGLQDTRFVESVAAAYSMIAVCTTDPVASLRENLISYLAEYEKYNKGDVMEDEDALLQDIILAKVRISTYQEDTTGADPKIIHVERTVGQILAQDPLPEDHHKNLQACGVRLRDDGSLFIAHEQARRELLRNTRWKDLNILQILSRIPGSEYKQKKLAGTRLYGVVIPEDVWRK